MTKTHRRIARRRSTSAKSLELKQFQQKIMPNKKKDIIPDIDFQDEQDCGIIEDNMKGESQ